MPFSSHDYFSYKTLSIFVTYNDAQLHSLSHPTLPLHPRLSPYGIDPLHPGQSQLVGLVLENVLGVVVGEFTGLANESGVLEGVASDLVVQTLQTVQETAMAKSVHTSSMS